MTDEDAAKLVAPVVEATEPAEVEPQQVRPRPAPARRAAPTAKLHPGDLVCGDCGEGNRPSRKFCSRCGTSLATAEVVKTPWWRRFRHRRGPRTLAAGSRPRRPGDSQAKHAFRTTLRRVRTAVGVLVLCFGLLSGFYPPLRTYVVQQVTSVKQKLRGVADTALTPIRPAAVQGTKSLAGHPPKAAFDTFSNTTWQAPSTDQAPAHLVVRLDHAVALRKIIVTNGDPKNFAALGRPATLELRYSNEKSELISLTDSPQPQELALHSAIGVSTITINVVTTYPAQGSTTIALAEIELFGIG